jgi:uncharacterized protein YqeY
MSLANCVNDELKAAMRAKDDVRKEALRALRGEILKIEKSGSDAGVSDDDVIKLAKTQIKQRQDAINQFQAAGRPELAAGEEAIVAILREFLPEPLTADELAALVDQAIAAAGAESMRDMGKVMGAVKPAIAATGKDVDGRALADMVKAKLSN